VLLGWFILGPLASALLRHAAHALTPLVMARAGYFRHAVIVGASPAGLAVADRIERSRSTGKRLLGFSTTASPSAMPAAASNVWGGSASWPTTCAATRWM
jgi:hypothetical protein